MVEVPGVFSFYCSSLYQMGIKNFVYKISREYFCVDQIPRKNAFTSAMVALNLCISHSLFVFYVLPVEARCSKKILTFSKIVKTFTLTKSSAIAFGVLPPFTCVFLILLNSQATFLAVHPGAHLNIYWGLRWYY